MKFFKSQQEVDEFVNEKRAERGLAPLPEGYHVTQIHEGMVTGCGCQITTVRPGSHFTIFHNNDCYLMVPGSRTPRREVVRCYEGQGVSSTADDHTKAVMRIDLPWPHEMEGWPRGSDSEEAQEYQPRPH